MLKKIFLKIYKLIFKYTPQEKYDLEENNNYQKWISNNEPSINELEEQRNTKFNYNPKISIVVPLYNTPEKYFEELIESVNSQTYSNWELCFADGSPKKIDYIDKGILKLGEKVKYKLLNENKGISGNTNEALKMATGDYIALLDHDDIIPKFALFEIVKVINENPNADFIYTDDDKILEEKDRRISPHFKQDFAIDTLRSYNYICHFSIIKKELMDKLGGFNSDFDGSQDYDLILRAVENANQIVHIPKILYHWRINPNSVASGAQAKPYAYVAAKKAILAHLERQGIENAKVEDSKIMGLYKVTYPVINNPKISIIILNKNHKKDLKRCVKSIVEKTSYNNYEIIIVENNSSEKNIFKYYNKIKSEKIRVETYNLEKFNYSKLNNYGVSKAKGDYYVFLNNDTKIISPDWLETIISNCQRKEVGAIGAKLIYKNKRIQHAGVVLNLTGTAGHVNWNEKSNKPGYFGRIMIQQNVSCVTGALLGISKTNFEQVGGFDESFPIAYNDVDLCLKLLDNNKLIIYNPYIEAYHFESKTRGYEDTKEKQERLRQEENKIKEKWKNYFANVDKYYSPNLRKDVPNMRIETERIVKNEI
ncbi:MAG: glycosyltransferase [Clostridia bacterium]|nr:glycosyltransferase [Clostridia bacterium]